MANQPFPQPDAPHARRFPVLKIIGTMMLVLILICGGLVTYVAYNFRSWAASFARGPLVSVVDQVDLSAEQKTSIKQNLNRVADAFQKGQISYTQFQAILQRLTTGPFFDLVQVEAMQHQYTLAHPTVDDEYKQTMLLFDRFERGIVEKTIPADQVRNVLALAHDPDEKHPNGASNQVTEAELKPFIDAARKAVEQANIPAEPFEPDFATEIDKAVNAVLGSPPATQPASAPASTQPESPAHTQAS